MKPMVIRDRYKEQVAHRFGHAAATYNTHAQLQYECAQNFLNLIKRWQSGVPQEPILEIGCGTGFITQGLINLFPEHYLHITDISSTMVEFCQSRLMIPDYQQDRISFRSMDGEEINSESQPYGAIVGGFVIQWFRNLIPGIQRLVNHLQPGGYLCLSFPTSQSFPEWQQICEQINVPFTANPLPNSEILQQALPENAQIQHMEELKQNVHYARSVDFFQDLKAIGATVNQTARRLPPRQMKQLIHTWDSQSPGQIQVSYHIEFWIIQREH